VIEGNLSPFQQQDKTKVKLVSNILIVQLVNFFGLTFSHHIRTRSLLRVLLLFFVLIWYPVEDEKRKMLRLIDRMLSGVPFSAGEKRDWLIQVWRMDRSLKYELWSTIAAGIDHYDYKKLRQEYTDVAHHEMNNMLRHRDKHRDKLKREGER
jgi:hypothetical protein